MSGIRNIELPFRYLGVPISTRRVTVVECHVLVEKKCVLDKNIMF